MSIGSICTTSVSFKNYMLSLTEEERAEVFPGWTVEVWERMRPKNVASKMVAEAASDHYNSTDIESTDLTVELVREFMCDFADDILSCEIDCDSFPEWTTLVATPAIRETINWNYVHYAVIESLKQRE